MGIRVFHCDDSEAFTRLVSFWLSEHDDIEYAGQAHTAEAALAALPEARPDVILLDTLGPPRRRHAAAARSARPRRARR